MKKKSIALSVSAGLLLPVPAVRAQFGPGLTVFDPSVWAEAVSEVTQLTQQYAQLVQTYQMITNQYKQMLFEAQRVPVLMAARYRALATPWRNSSAANTYGTTGGWTAGINTGLGVPAGYAKAVEALGSYGAAMSVVPVNQQSRLQKYYGTIELADGANITGIETVGTMRGNAPEVAATIQSLENDSLSSDPDMNTEIAVLNKINAASIIGLRNTQDTNKLLTTLAEERLIESKRQRDAAAQAVNNHVRFLSEEPGYLASQKAGTTEAMLHFRMP